MDANAFTPNASGHLVRNLDGVLPFVPEPLPSGLKLPPKLLQAESKVSNLLGRLEGTARMLPDPGIAMKRFGIVPPIRLRIPVWTSLNALNAEPSRR